MNAIKSLIKLVAVVILGVVMIYAATLIIMVIGMIGMNTDKNMSHVRLVDAVQILSMIGLYSLIIYGAYNALRYLLKGLGSSASNKWPDNDQKQ